jgi:hypothetical protein
VLAADQPPLADVHRQAFSVSFSEDKRQLLSELGVVFQFDEHLAHAGVKGMRWGVRKKPEEGGQRSGLSPTNQKAVTAAFVIGGAITAAILIKRGRIPASTIRNTSQAARGAKLAGRVLLKTGRVIVRGSAKAGKAVGKTAGKGGVKVVGKVGGGIARGIRSGTVNGGYKAYENILKKPAMASARLSGRLASRLTGRGAPAVEEVAKKGILSRLADIPSPTDLLLNTRNDSLRG